MNDSNFLFAADILSLPSEWKDRDSWKFEAFALHFHETSCNRCSNVTHHSEPFRMFVKTHPAATDRRFIPATSVPETLSIITFKLPVKHVPICHNCITENRVGTQTILISSDRAWQDAQHQIRINQEKIRLKETKKTVEKEVQPIPML